jgi:hypothetical protein
MLVCPHTGEGRDWIPKSYNPETRTLYSTLVETCMDLTPIGKDERGFLSTGVRHSVGPRLDSDGKSDAFKQPIWRPAKQFGLSASVRPEFRAASTPAGGLIFSGNFDHVFYGCLGE